MSESAPIAEEELDDEPPPRSTWILLVLCGAQLLLALTVTIVLIGGAAIKRSIAIPDGDVHWLVTAYSLTFGGLVLLGGRVGDTIGHRRMFVGGLALFGLTSLAVAWAGSTRQIVAARAVQGIAAAAVSPATLALLTEAFVGQRQRARAFAAWSLAGSSGGVTGYLAGGAVIDSVGWRWAFAANVLIAGLGVVGGLALLPAGERRQESTSFDVGGAVTISGAAFALVWGFGRAQAEGWTSRSSIVSTAVSAALVVAFLVVESRAAQPLIPVRLIKRRAFAANVVALCSSATVSGTLMVASLFLQEERAYSARHAGLSTLPVPIGVAIGARLTTWLVRRRPDHDGTGVAVAGLTLSACGYALAAWRVAGDSYVTSFLPAWALMGIGLPMASIPILTIATAGIDPTDRGIVSGIFNMAQQLGAAVGVAALWTVTQAAANDGMTSAAARAGFVAATVIGLASATFTAGVLTRRWSGRRNRSVSVAA